MKLTRKEQTFETTYSVARIALKEVSEICDFVIIVETRLTFSNHVNDIVSSVTTTVGFVLRCSREFKNPVSWNTTLQYGHLIIIIIA